MIDVTADMVKVTSRAGRTMVGGRVLAIREIETRPDTSAQNIELTGHADFLFGSQSLDADAPSTRDRDKALLIELGVDGDVPLTQARRNAGLDTKPANDNNKLAALAA